MTSRLGTGKSLTFFYSVAITVITLVAHLRELCNNSFWSIIKQDSPPDWHKFRACKSSHLLTSLGEWNALRWLVAGRSILRLPCPPPPHYPTSLFPISRLCPLSLIARISSLISRPSSLVNRHSSHPYAKPSSLIDSPLVLLLLSTVYHSLSLIPCFSSFFSRLPSLIPFLWYIVSHSLFIVLLLLPLVSHPSSLIHVPPTSSLVLFDHCRLVWHSAKTFLLTFATPLENLIHKLPLHVSGDVIIVRKVEEVRQWPSWYPTELICSCWWTSYDNKTPMLFTEQGRNTPLL